MEMDTTSFISPVFSITLYRSLDRDSGRNHASGPSVVNHILFPAYFGNNPVYYNLIRPLKAQTAADNC
jgi:hypothetical protein